MTIWEKVNKIIIKKCNSEAIYNKKNLKAEKRFNSKKSFQCFYTTVILFDSVHGKDGSCYLEGGFLFPKIQRSCISRNIRKAFF